MKKPRAGAKDASYGDRLLRVGPLMSPASLRVAQYIDRNRPASLAASALDLAAASDTSDATVVRAVQALGFAGLGDLKQALLAELGRPTPAGNMRRTLTEVGENAQHAIAAVLDAHAEAIAMLRSDAARTSILEATAILQPAERIVVFGIGPSAAVAGYVSMMLRRSGRRSAKLDATGLMLADQMLDLAAGDALLVLAYGRPYREVLAVFAEARRLGLALVLVTDSPGSRMARSADVVLPGRRGRTGRVALHGATFAMLEALTLGLSAAEASVTVSELDRLNDLREAVSGERYKAGG